MIEPSAKLFATTLLVDSKERLTTYGYDKKQPSS